MTHWLVVARVFNIYMGDTAGLMDFTVNGVTFRALPNAAKLYSDGGAKQQHIATAEVSLNVDANTPEEAVRNAENDVLPALSLALTFAHGHHVFFWGFKCYPGSQKSGKPVYRSRSSIRTGQRAGSGRIVYHSWKLPSYLEVVVPKLRDEGFLKKTGLRLALVWYLEPFRTVAMPIEARFISYWLSLETMARHYAKEAGKTALLGRREFQRLRKKIEAVLEEVVADDKDKEQIISGLGWLNKLSIRRQIGLLLKDCHLPTYTDDIGRFSKRRNDLLHGRNVSEDEFLDDYMRIKRLLDKVILTRFGIYGADYLHPTMMEEDLLAR